MRTRPSPNPEISFKFLGAGDGDGGFINLRFRNGKVYGGGIHFPNSPALPGLTGDGRRYNLACGGGESAPVVTSGPFPAYLDELDGMNSDISEVEGGVTARISGVTEQNFQNAVKKTFNRDVAAVMTFSPLRQEAQVSATLDEVFSYDGAGEISAERTENFMNAMKAPNNAKLYRLESQGEDGMWIVYGIVVLDTRSGNALIIHMETQA